MASTSEDRRPSVRRWTYLVGFVIVSALALGYLIGFDQDRVGETLAYYAVGLAVIALAVLLLNPRSPLFGRRGRDR